METVDSESEIEESSSSSPEDAESEDEVKLVTDATSKQRQAKVSGFKNILTALGVEPTPHQKRKGDIEEDDTIVVDSDDKGTNKSRGRKKGSDGNRESAEDEKDGVTGTDFKSLFTGNPKYETDKSKPSHLCSICGGEFSLTTLNKKNKARTQWQNAKSHISNCHPENFKSVVEKKMKVLGDPEKEARERKQKDERERMMATHGALLVSKNRESVANLLRDPEAEEKVEPIYNTPTLDRFHEIKAHLTLAYMVAKDNLSMNSFEKEGYRFAARLLGLEGLMPVAKTIRRSQEFLAGYIVERHQKALNALISGSPLPVISIQTDVWSDHTSAQQMGIRVTGLNPVTFEWITIPLPLESAEEVSLDSYHEAELVAKGLERLNLSPENIYSQTTDTASVAVLGAVRNFIIHVPCRSHMLALAFKDVLKVPDAKNYDLEKDDDAQFNGIMQNLALRHLRGVAARAAHFGRSPTASRALDEYQSAHGKVERNFIQWSPTRWLGIYQALLRDTAILNDGGDKFIDKYVKQIEKSSPKVASKIGVDLVTSAKDGCLLLAILKPFHDLTLELQRDDISLAQAHLSILTSCNELYRATYKEVNSAGVETGVLRAVGHLPEHFAKMREDLRKAMYTRLIKERLDDETIVSVALDPFSFAMISGLAKIGAHDDIKNHADECLRRAREYGEVMIISRMTKVSKAKIRLEKEQTEQTDASTLNEPSSEEKPDDAAAQANQEEEGDTMKQLQQYIIATNKERLSNPATSDDEMLEAQMKNEYQRFVVARGHSPTMTAHEFWKAKAIEYPHLFHVFLQSQSSRPSSSRLESVFSVASVAVPVQRESLTIESLNNILLLKFAKVSPEVIQKAATHKYQEEVRKKCTSQSQNPKPKRLKAS